ncbi:glycosyltransferase [Aquibacillus halophilus]|uniref:Glycosyltransferase n=1 Tax=Aquibacillus halophilus TaxID=930132 RepID=A0A6A8DAQ4_9BACI|nr:glycosyltransferase family 1 protein [Aquibacillus halophilus]MRH42688.1 glycosyltransferase [Aquibacillus halophilus]
MVSPLRVLHVVVNMNRGGAETLIMNLYRNIDRSKVQFDFLTCKQGIFDSEIVAMGGKVHRIPYLTDVGHLNYKRMLEEFFKTNNQYKIVHSHMDKMSGLVLRAAKKENIPVRIAHSHNTRSEGALPSRTYKWYTGRYINNNATHLFGCSIMASKWLFGKRANEAFILKNGIDTFQFQYSSTRREKIRKELNINKDTLVLGHVGRFSSQKNHFFLLEVFANLIKNIPNTVLILVGDGSLKQKIIERIKKLNLDDKVKVLGVREDISLLLQSFDLFVFPSIHEGLPVTLVEAQGAGLPCVISDSITKEVDMEIGLVHSLPINDCSIWVKKITQIANNNYSRGISDKSFVLRGYDIKKTAVQTQLSYLTLGEKAI